MFLDGLRVGCFFGGVFSAGVVRFARLVGLGGLDVLFVVDSLGWRDIRVYGWDFACLRVCF